MRSSPALLALVLVLPLCALGAPVPKEADKPVYYCPTKVGDTWDYVNPEEKEKTTCIAWTVLAVEEKNGVKTVQFGQFYAIDGKFHEEHDLEVSAKGIIGTRSPVVLGIPRKKYDSPQIDLKLPHKDGQSWENKDFKETLTAYGPEEVKVPAGTYQAIRVEHHANSDPKDRILRTYWYAPRVGIVKVKAGDLTLVMKSFTPGKD